VPTSQRCLHLDGKIDMDFLTENDYHLIGRLLPRLRPKYVAISFVKTVDDIRRLKAAMRTSLGHHVNEYYPRIVAKIEMADAIEPRNISSLIDECDMIMIARGDLALETTPVHIRVPFIQADLVQRCRRANKPFVVATQILESMITCSVPTRAEMSDLYRAVVLDNANYVMLSGEAAVGQYPEECVRIMHDLIDYYQTNKIQQCVQSNGKRADRINSNRLTKTIRSRRSKSIKVHPSRKKEKHMQEKRTSSIESQSR
jgi:pyruvate kinase